MAIKGFYYTINCHLNKTISFLAAIMGIICFQKAICKPSERHLVGMVCLSDGLQMRNRILSKILISGKNYSFGERFTHDINPFPLF
jgi:hypothetical protein